MHDATKCIASLLKKHPCYNNKEVIIEGARNVVAEHYVTIIVQSM